jgi:DNA-binding response OmpR family regulator
MLAADTRAREAGADAFLKKPLAEHRLVQVVRDLLNPSRPSAATGSS